MVTLDQYVITFTGPLGRTVYRTDWPRHIALCNELRVITSYMQWRLLKGAMDWQLYIADVEAILFESSRYFNKCTNFVSHNNTNEMTPRS